MGVVSIDIPRSLYEEARRRGINVEDLILDVLISKLKLDPKGAAEARLELAGKYLREAREYLRRGDPTQASEKMYRVVEECIKVLAQIRNTPEHRQAFEEGRWWTQLLGKAARRLAKELSEPKIADTWSRAYDIHVWGFHEGRYSIEDITEDMEYVEWLLNYVKQVVRCQPQHTSRADTHTTNHHEGDRS